MALWDQIQEPLMDGTAEVQDIRLEMKIKSCGRVGGTLQTTALRCVQEDSQRTSTFYTQNTTHIESHFI